MNSDIISTIKDAEKECREVYERKAEELKNLVRNAKVEAQDEAENKILAFNEQCQKRLDDATVHAENEVQQLMDQNKLQCKALQDLANRNMQKSIDYILGRVVG